MTPANITWYSPQQLEAMRNEALVNRQLAESKKVLKRMPDERDDLAKELIEGVSPEKD